MTRKLSPDDEELLADLLLRWEDSLDSTEPQTAELLCGQRADLVVELSRRMSALGSMDRLMTDGRARTRLMDPAEFESISAPDCPSIPGFRILGEIGRGGMGIVYKAVQLNLGRHVALKLINSLSQNPKMLISRLRVEAESLAKLNHEHVIRVHDVIDRQGMVCLVLEYVDGGNLAQRDTQSSIDSKSAAQIALTVAETMSDVHRARLLHRDLKPGNVLRDSRGRIKISDFGLAKHLAPNSLVSMTTEGIGSPSYMAPEQAIGVAKEIGEWTDVYGIGATLYDLITGRPPFLGATHLATLEQVRSNDPVSPRLLVPEIPIDLETICLKCLAKEPRNRYPTAAALASDLKNFLEGKPISARPLGPIGQTWRWTKRNPDRAGLIAAMAVGFMLAVGLGAWEITRLNDAANEKQLRENNLEVALDRAQTKEFYLSLSEISDQSLRTPTGWSWANLDALKKVAPLRPHDDQAALIRLRSEATKALTAFDARKQRELLHGFDPYAIEFSPDGSLLAAGANADDKGTVKVALIDTATWETKHTLNFEGYAPWVRDKPDGVRSLLFSPDGKELYVGSRSGWIYVFALSSMKQVRHWSAHGDYILRIRFSSDEKTLLTCSKNKVVKKWTQEGQQLLEVIHDCELTDLVVVNDRHYPQTPMIAVAGQNPLWLRESDFRRIEPDESQREKWNRSHQVTAAYPDGGGWIRDSGSTLEVLDSHHAQSLRKIVDRNGRLRSRSEFDGIDVSHDGRLLFTSNADAAKLWDLAGGQLVTEIPVAGRSRVVSRFKPRSDIAVLANNSRLTVYEMAAESIWKNRLQQPHILRHMTITADGARVAATRFHGFYNQSNDACEPYNQLLISDTEQPTITILNTYPGRLPNSVRCVPGGHGVCMSFIDIQTLQQFHFDRSLGFGVRSPEFIDVDYVRFSPDGRRLYFTAKTVVGPSDVNDRPSSAIKVLETATSEVKTLWANSESERTLRISKIESFAVGSKYLVCSSLDGNIRTLDPESGSVLGMLSLNTVSDAVALAPNEKNFVAGTQQGELLVVSVPSGTIRQKIAAHLDTVKAVAFAGPDLVVSCSRDRDLKLWKVGEEGMLTELLTLGPLSDQVRELSASDDGNVVAVLVEEETAVRILRVDLLRQRLAEYGLDW